MSHPVLCVDIGSTRLKGALVDGPGHRLSVVAEPSPLAQREVDPYQVLAAAAALAARACGSVRPSAIAVTGATRSLVCVASDGSALGGMIKLDDPRGAQFQQVVQQACAAASGRGLGAGHTLARALDLRAREPGRYRRMHRLLELKDWINLQLTGEAACDTIALARLAPSAQALPGVLATLGLAAGLCGSAVDPGTQLGTVRASPGPWQRWQGVPVVECGFDAWCASFGMGCVQDLAVYNVCGTTEVFGSFCVEAREVAGVPCLPWGAGLFHLGGPCLTGLGTLAWFGERFLGDPDPAGVLACAARAGADTPLCLPFVSGERMPFWREDLRASFTQLHSGHGLPEMAQALVDGLLVFQAWLLRRLQPAPRVVYLSGGGATLDGWAQRKACAFGATVLLPQCVEPGLAGAALCAQVALGRFDSLLQAQQALAPDVCSVDPLAQETRRLRDIEERLLPLFPALPDT